MPRLRGNIILNSEVVPVELKTRSLNCRIGVMVILMEMHVEYKWK